MEDKTFVWTPELTKKFFKLRFEHEWLFQEKKQPWHEFRQIMLDRGFPEEMTIDHVRKKWSYTYDCYRLAKKSGNHSWVYYKLFDKHFGKKEILDKYESWNDEWRLKLIICMTEARDMKLEYKLIWSTIETALRSQELPIDCCIQDIKGLWHHIVTTFNRKHRIKIKKGAELTDWPLYDAMLVFHQKFEPDHLLRLESESAMTIRERKSNKHLWRQVDPEQECDFHWTKDITETFIQLRLQYDSIFKEKKWAWGDLQEIMIKEHGFPETLSSRELCRKWAWTYAEYQKAKATNKPWVYADLFELYLGEGNLSLNPIVAWKEEWIHNLITARTDFEHLFKFPNRERENQGWRDVEKALRTMGLPLEHSVLELRDLWTYLVRTYRWKRKFADRGTLTEQWPYFEAMSRFKQVQAAIKLDPNISPPVKVKRERGRKRKYSVEDHDGDDDWDDDIKLFDLKQRLQVKPKFELPDAVCCRTCEQEEGAVNIYEYIDELGLDVAFKLRVIAGVEVERTDSLPSHMCYSCLQLLEDAFKFRQKCQEVDKNYRKNPPIQIKVEIKSSDLGLSKSKTENENEQENDHDDHMDEPDRTDFFELEIETDAKPKEQIKTEKPRRKRRKPKKVPSKYDYCKICEVCGKYTRNLKNHMDMHGSGKTYTCEICDKKFKFKSGLVIHKAVHDPSPRKTCEVCGKTFHILAQYRRHFVYHANERKYECETCGKRFNTMDILKVHARIHTDERPFSCSDCGKTFRTAGCVSRHKRIVHRKQAKMQQLDIIPT